MNDHEHKDPFDQGLQHDLLVLNAQANRRKVLGWLAAAGLMPILACGGSELADDGSSAGASGSGTTGTSAAGTSAAGTSAAGTSGAAGDSSAGASSTDVTSCSKIPEETAGPYPGDGSNGPNVLTASGIVRDDITTSFGTLSGTAAGVPLTITLKIVDASGCANLSGYAVYIWHCDRDGNYSMYTAATQNYLRGVQETAADGTVTFKSIFPACYSGRWPHIHFEVYESLELATLAGAKRATSQLALPKAQCDEVFATTGYEKSVANLAQISLATDMVFSDGAQTETPTMIGSVAGGYTATLTIGV